MAGAPALYIIAGPNGAGKSTLTSALLPRLGIPILDPDAVARDLTHPASDLGANNHPITWGMSTGIR